MAFCIEHVDEKTGARCGILKTAHGSVPTPIFMPVGTQGTVKTVSPDELVQTGTRMILGNTYHLYLRPGDALIRKAGGLHAFMAWKRPILTDSGGFQVHSLENLRRIHDDSVVFQSHLDGSYHTFTPDSVIDIQRNLGSDVVMVLDECTSFPCSFETAWKAHERTIVWAVRSLERFRSGQPVHGKKQSLFAIVQGSTFKEIRKASAEQLAALPFDGFAIGGLAVGEPRSLMLETTGYCTSLLPTDKPRYLMGVGKPEDIVEAVALGIDMFDCVIPTRNARKGTVYTWKGKLVVKNKAYESDFIPIDEECGCSTCRRFTRAYLRHLFHSDELLGMRLATIHNLHFYNELLNRARNAILGNTFKPWVTSFFRDYTPS